MPRASCELSEAPDHGILAACTSWSPTSHDPHPESVKSDGVTLSATTLRDRCPPDRGTWDAPSRPAGVGGVGGWGHTSVPPPPAWASVLPGLREAGPPASPPPGPSFPGAEAAELTCGTQERAGDLV